MPTSGSQSQSFDPKMFLKLLAAAAGMPQAAQGQQADGTQTTELLQWPGLFGKGHEDARKMNQRFSICCGSDADTQNKVDADKDKVGIDSILEGFGLLSFKMEGICSEDSGQTVNDVTAQPSLENIARKQQDLPQQWLWAVPFIQAQEQNAGDAQSLASLAQGVIQAMQDAQVEPKAMPKQVRDAIMALMNKVQGEPDTAFSQALDAASAEQTSTPGQSVKAALLEGLQQALAGTAADETAEPVPVHAKQANGTTVPQGNAFGVHEDVPTVVASAKQSGESQNDDAKDPKPQGEKAHQGIEKMQPRTQAFGLETAQKPQTTQNTGRMAGTQAVPEQGGEKIGAADMAHNAMKIVESIQTHKDDGNYEMSVTLRPDSLGKVSIKLVMDDSGLKAQIKAESVAAKEALGGQIDTLAESLKEKGIQVSHLEVTYEAPAFNAQQQQQYEGRNRGQSSHKSARAYISQNAEAVDGVSTRGEADLAIKNGSIEFQA